MASIEALREKLYLAIENGDLQQVLEVSRELDCEIVNFMRGYLDDKLVHPKTSCLQKYQ